MGLHTFSDTTIAYNAIPNLYYTKYLIRGIAQPFANIYFCTRTTNFIFKHYYL